MLSDNLNLWTYFDRCYVAATAARYFESFSQLTQSVCSEQAIVEKTIKDA